MVLTNEYCEYIYKYILAELKICQKAAISKNRIRSESSTNKSSSFRTLSCQQFSCLSCQQVRKICQKATKATCNSKKELDRKAVQKISSCQIEKKKQFESWQVVWKLSAVIQHAKWKGWWGWNSSHHRRRWTQKRSRGLDVKQRSSSFKSGFF